jgi:hypothetical protein
VRWKVNRKDSLLCPLDIWGKTRFFGRLASLHVRLADIVIANIISSMWGVLRVNNRALVMPPADVPGFAVGVTSNRG